MDENNQILDVTYGNFSCRLEGFEDSVEIMKTVVSFFHDLAGHNRFMDVAPQAPDMSTLARLTEDQAGVAVEVEGDGNHVSLRAVEDDVEDAAAELDEDFADEFAAVEEETDDDDMAIDTDTSVTAKLDRIRAVVDRDAEDSDDETYAEDLSEGEPKAQGVNPLAQRLADLAKRTSQTRILDDANEYVESDVASAAESSFISAADDYAEDQDDAGADLVSETDADENVFVEELMDEELASVEDATADEVDDLEDAIEETADEVEALEDIAAEVDNVDTEVEETVEELAQDIIEDDVDMAEAEMETEADAAIEEETIDAMVAEVEDEIDAVEEEAVAEEPQADHPARREHTTLVLTPSDAADDDDDEPELAEIDQSKVDNATDDDFDLATEVALVEAEIARRQGNEVARHGLSRRVEDAMSRIMSQTDQHLNKPESRRHRDAFAQLKAAVAATEAARQLGDKGDARDPDEVFKDDLDVHAAESKDDLGVSEAAEVNEAKGGNDGKVKPLDAASERLRQIASLKEAEGVPETTGFAEFAQAHGATELVDMLEAAGAYICFVEGEADFSRPQVMKVVQTASEGEVSREDGLRCFGRLLRQTRIVKMDNGRFQVAETSQYRPDDQRAAQA